MLASGATGPFAWRLRCAYWLMQLARARNIVRILGAQAFKSSNPVGEAYAEHSVKDDAQG